MGWQKRVNTNTNKNIQTDIREYEYQYEYSSHTVQYQLNIGINIQKRKLVMIILSQFYSGKALRIWIVPSPVQPPASCLLPPASLVKEHISNIGIPLYILVFVVSIIFRLLIFFGFLFLFQTSLLCIMGELAGGGSVAVAFGVSDRWQATFGKCP